MLNSRESPAPKGQKLALPAGRWEAFTELVTLKTLWKTSQRKGAWFNETGGSEEKEPPLQAWEESV